MDRADVKSIITPSASSFYQKIINKYQIGEVNNLSFPKMIFHKSFKCFPLQKIEATVRFQLHFNPQTNAPSSIFKSISIIKGVIQWKDTQKNNLLFNEKPKSVHNADKVPDISRMALKTSQMYHFPSSVFLSISMLADKISMISYLKFLDQKTVKRRKESFKISKTLLQALNTAVNPQTNSRTPSSNVVFYPQVSDQRYNINSLNSQMLRERLKCGLLKNVNFDVYLDKNAHKDKYKLPSFLSHDNLFFNSTSGSFKPLESSSVQKSYYNNTDTENLRFQDTRWLEYEIEQIKKTVILTKESVLEKVPPIFGDADIKRHLDINRISDQVYQNLERKIRMERERRGV